VILNSKVWGSKKLDMSVPLQENDDGDFDEGDLDIHGRRGLWGGGVYDRMNLLAGDKLAWMV
jgi:hypothetical protein